MLNSTTSGAISRQTQQTRSTPQPSYQPRGRGYNRGRGSSTASTPRSVVIGGVTFVASGRSLVRKNDVNDLSTTLNNPTPVDPPPATSTFAITTAPQAVAGSLPTSTMSSGHLSTSTTLLSSNAMIRTKKGTLVAANRLKTHHRSSPSAISHPPQSFNSRRGVIRGRGRGLARGVRSQRVQQSRYVSFGSLETLEDIAKTHMIWSRFKLANRQPIDKPCREFTRRGDYLLLTVSICW